MKKGSVFVSFVDKQLNDRAFQWSEKCAVCLIRLKKVKKPQEIGGLVVFVYSLDCSLKIFDTN